MSDTGTMREVGDYSAAFALPSTRDKAIGANELLGRPFVLFFYLTDAADGFAQLACGFRNLYSQFSELGVEVMGIGVQNVDVQKRWVDALRLPYPLGSDADAQVSTEFGIAQHDSPDLAVLAAARTTFLMNAGLRILKRYENIDSEHHAAEVLNDSRKMLYPEPPRTIIEHAPVLLQQNVLTPEMCQELIELWETDGNEDSGFMKQVDGKTVGMVDYNHKIRRDHFLKSGPLLERLRGRVAGRAIPDLQQAFNYNVTRFEDFRVACYDASCGGYFRPHRDNTTDGTAHRRFAMSLLLNDNYEGGHLRFPEHSAHLYRPKAGSAVVFSCSLLHEATDVTAGRRFVLLSFFYGEAEARRREEYARRNGGGYRA